MYKILLFLVFFFFSSLSWSNCKSLIPGVVKSLHPSSTLGPSYLNICKVWPYSPDKTLVVMTLISNISDKNADDSNYDIDVAVVDSKNGQIITHQYDSKVIHDDAVYLDSITIDTAPYQLNASTRAFGVRFNYKNSYKSNAYSGEMLNLYYIQDKTLQIGVRGLSMAQVYGEWDEIKCSGVFKDIRRILAVEKVQQHGFNNLRINEILTSYKPEFLDHYGCVNADEKIKKSSYILQYNGKEYEVPKEYKYLYGSQKR